jgi:DNA-binding transcriptional MerR regulator
VSADTIRYYEKIGLMPAPPRTGGGYRDYSSDAVKRIRVIRNAVRLGFPLREIANVLRVRDAGGAPCRGVRDYASAMVEHIEGRIAELRAERRAMQAMIREWDTRLAATPPGARARLLEGDVPARRATTKTARLR